MAQLADFVDEGLIIVFLSVRNNWAVLEKTQRGLFLDLGAFVEGVEEFRRGFVLVLFLHNIKLLVKDDVEIG